MAQQGTQLAEIIKFFSLALKQYRLYSPTHPAAQMAFRNLFAALEGALGAGSLTLGFMEGQILANEQAFDKKQTGVADLLKECQHLHIESLIFDPGVTEDELGALLRAMTVPLRTLAETGGFKSVFDKESFQRIRLGISRYRMIKEEEEVVKKSELGAASGQAEAEGGPPARRRVERMEEIIEHGLTGAEDDIDYDVERLSYEVERRPESVARQMIRRADNLESLKRIVQDMGSFLRERLAQPFVQQGKDFSRTVSRLAKEFKKVVETFDSPEDFRGSVKELVSVLQQCADAVKLELIVRTFEQSGKDAGALAKIKAKFLSGKQARERLMEPLKERLLGLGVGEIELEQVFAAEEKQESKRSKAAEESDEEISELPQLQERYEEESKTVRGALARAQGQKERLENIIESLAEGLVVVDNEGKIQMMNPAAEKLLGIGQTEGLGVPIGQSVKAEHIVALTKGPLLDESDEVTKEIAVQSIDDETRKTLRESSAVIKNEQGQTVGMVAVVSDITKQKKQTEDVGADEVSELRQLKERYEQEIKTLRGELGRALGHKERLENIIGSLAEGLVVVDNEGKIQMINPAAEKLLGMTQSDGLGNHIGKSLKAEHIVALTKGPLLDESEVVNKEIEIKAIDDEARKILQASSAVIENEAGQTVGMVAVLSDITKQKKLDEMKSKFVAHVSHELRTPLLAIEQSLHILLSKEIEAVTPAQEQFLHIADRNISRLSRLVNDLLDVAKIEAREMKLKPIVFKMNDLVHHVVETMRGWAESKKIVIEEKRPATDVEVEADPDRLIQVVTNLVGNAIKFTPDGGRITLEIDPHYSDPQISPEPCIAVGVRDTGMGIAPEDQERIFRKFEQAELPLPSEGVGSTGLGLTIAKEIVELHKGRIWVESKPGEGSRFAFAIARRLQDRSATATAAR